MASPAKHSAKHVWLMQAGQLNAVKSELTVSQRRHAAKCRAIKALEGRLAVTEAGLANALVQHRMQVWGVDALTCDFHM
jgi:hypothetical protein